jgi:hypothetical protein
VAGLHGDADHEHHLGEPEANPARRGHRKALLSRFGRSGRPSNDSNLMGAELRAAVVMNELIN